MDENVCMGLCTFVFEDIDKSTAQKMFKKSCKKFARQLPMHGFFRSDGMYSPQCFSCRKEHPIQMIPKMSYCFANIDADNVVEEISLLHSCAFYAAQHMEWRVNTVFEADSSAAQALPTDSTHLTLNIEGEIVRENREHRRILVREERRNENTSRIQL